MIKNIIQVTFLCFSLVVVQVHAFAEIYRWVDDRGRIQFSDQPPISKKAETLDLPEISTYQGVTVSEVEDYKEFSPARYKELTKRKRVTLYSAEWCGMCKKAKKHFKSKKIRFKEYDIDKSKKARKAFDKMKATGIPVILIGKTRMNGFNKAQFDKIYY